MFQTNIGISFIIIFLSLSSHSIFANTQKLITTSLPDLTKGDVWNWPENKNELGRDGFYNLGPTGIMGFMVGGYHGSQIEVALVLPDSPASTKIKVGDVILGINGTAFKKDCDLREVFGKAINNAEKKINDGYLNLLIWRDKNWKARTHKEAIPFSTIENLLNPDTEEEAFDISFDLDDSTAQPISSEKIKIDAKVHNIILKLPVLGEFSQTSPYLCKKSKKIIDRGLKVVREKAKSDLGLNYLRGHVLLATGEAKDIQLVKDFLYKDEAFQPQRKINPTAYPKGSQRLSYQALLATEYYFASNQNHILIPLRNIVSTLARGQTHGGMWGYDLKSHPLDYGEIFSRPSGSGIINHVSGTAFLSLVLAKKAGVFDEYCDYAIENASKVYSAISGHGCLDSTGLEIVESNDIDGNNGASAFTFKLLNDIHHAKYFAMVAGIAIHKKHNSNKTFFNGSEHAVLWSSLSASLLGEKAIQSYHRQHRNWYALSRLHDGRWIHQLPGGGLSCKADSTSMYLLQYLSTNHKTTLTGKEKNEQLILNDEELKDLQLNAHEKTKIVNKLQQVSIETCLDHFNTFSPVLRNLLSTEVGKKISVQKSTQIPAALLKLVHDGSDRQKATALLSIAASGEQHLKKHLKLFLKHLNQSNDFIAIHTIKALGPHYKNLEPLLINTLLKLASHKKYTELKNDINSVPYHCFNILFPQNADDSQFARSPFSLGLSEKLVQQALERGLSLDPGKEKLLRHAHNWNTSTIAKTAGPLIYAIENLPLNDIANSNLIRVNGNKLLKKNNYTRELLEVSSKGLIDSSMLLEETDLSHATQYKAFVDAETIAQYPSDGYAILSHLTRLFKKNPVLSFSQKDKTKNIYLYNIIKDIKKQSIKNNSPSLTSEVERLFNKSFLSFKDNQNKIAFCISQLKQNKKNVLLQRITMDKLVKLQGSDAIEHILPFLNHTNWRLREHSHKLICSFKKLASASLIQACMNNQKKLDGVLKCITAIADPNCAVTALQSFLQSKGTTRAKAVQALISTSGLSHFETILRLFKTCESPIEFEGYLKAFALLKGNTEAQNTICNALFPLIENSRDPMRKTIYSVLSKFGGLANLEYLKEQLNNKDKKVSLMTLNALVQAEDPKATDYVLDHIQFHKGMLISFDAADIALKRIPLLLDADGNLDEAAIVDYISRILNIVNHKKLILLLGNIVNLKSVQCLNKCLDVRSEVTRLTAIRSMLLFCKKVHKEHKDFKEIKSEISIAIRKIKKMELSNISEMLSAIENRFLEFNR